MEIAEPMALLADLHHLRLAALYHAIRVQQPLLDKEGLVARLALRDERFLLLDGRKREERFDSRTASKKTRCVAMQSRHGASGMVRKIARDSSPRLSLRPTRLSRSKATPLALCRLRRMRNMSMSPSYTSHAHTATLGMVLGYCA